MNTKRHATPTRSLQSGISLVNPKVGEEKLAGEQQGMSTLYISLAYSYSPLCEDQQLCALGQGEAHKSAQVL